MGPGTAVRFAEARPHELDEAIARFPVAYVPLGTLEWHGYHLPLGTDSLKAAGILDAVAERVGGVVLPPIYFGVTSQWHPWSFGDVGIDTLAALCEHVFGNLADLGFKIIVGVTGHDVPEQVEAMKRALQATRQRHDIDGFVIMEGDLTDFGEHRMDHAGRWETAMMMHLRPDLVELDRLEGVVLDGKIHMDEWESPGIGGHDPRDGASAELGERLVGGIADAIAKKATDLLRAK